MALSFIGHCEPVTDVTGVAIPKIDATADNALLTASGSTGGFSRQRARWLRMTRFSFYAYCLPHSLAV